MYRKIENLNIPLVRARFQRNNLRKGQKQKKKEECY